MQHLDTAKELLQIDGLSRAAAVADLRETTGISRAQAYRVIAQAERELMADAPPQDTSEPGTIDCLAHAENLFKAALRRGDPEEISKRLMLVARMQDRAAKRQGYAWGEPWEAGIASLTSPSETETGSNDETIAETDCAATDLPDRQAGDSSLF